VGGGVLEVERCAIGEAPVRVVAAELAGHGELLSWLEADATGRLVAATSKALQAIRVGARLALESGGRDVVGVTRKGALVGRLDLGRMAAVLRSMGPAWAAVYAFAASQRGGAGGVVVLLGG
jgi:hypothetical protein